MDNLQEFLKKNKNKKIVLCHGVFDLIHIGHIKYFEQAKKFGEILIVSVTADKFVNKGDGRPKFSQELREKLLKSIKYIDLVIINNYPTAINIIKKIKPHYYCKGKDYKDFSKDITNNILLEKKAVERNKGKLVFTNSKIFSSSEIINEYFSDFTAEQKNILLKIKDFTNSKKFISLFNALAKKKVILIGESIIDEYIYTNPIGKSAKEALLVTQQINKKKFIGGALSIANILSAFCKKVTFISYIGSTENQIKFIKKNLNKNVELKFFVKKNSPTISKTRYLDDYENKKLFAVYKINDEYMSLDCEKKIISSLDSLSKKNDAIIVIDYGHGLITKKIAHKINSLKIFKTLNVQFNAFNQLFQKISKYKNFNYSCFNIRELSNELKIKNEQELLKEIPQFIKKINCKKMSITLGKDGSKLFNISNKNINFCPSVLNSQPLDRIGAGDAFYSISSLLSSMNVTDEFLQFFSSYFSTYALKNNGPIQNIKFKEVIKNFIHMCK
jgi:rfaE bifunctional protein nucleotidyltransferase chain/domain